MDDAVLHENRSVGHAAGEAHFVSHQKHGHAFAREILDDGRCGLLIPPKDKDALAEAIRWIFEHQAEAEAMGVHGRRRVEQFYTWQAEGEKLIALYQRLAGSAEASSCAY